MKLSSLIKDIEIKEIVNFKNINITNLSIRADQLTKNGLFFAIKGNIFDGKSFINEAIEHGAKAVIVEEKLPNINIPQIVVKDIRKTLSVASRVFFNKCDKKLKVIAIVGTNGKTTTSTLIYHMLRKNGEKVGLIGTNGVFINDLTLPNLMTTPDPIELFYTLEQMVLFNVKYVIIEVSAHAIYYNKLYGITPDIIVYTNISNEHLDFFSTMENYSKVKLDYIKSFKNAIKVINIDDNYSKELLNLDNLVTYGLSNPADTFAIDIELSLNGSKFVCNCLDNVLEISSNLIGDYNVYNIMGAIAVAKKLDIDNEIIKNTLKEIKKISGRWEIFNFPDNNKVIVDYAHTPDGFEKILSNVKNFRKGRIITLFGCVGYSDKNKRKLMGDVAKKYSDFVIITSDNFSEEKFDEIANDIGLTKYYAKIKNRTKAVDFAIKMLSKNDTLLLLGKGNENTVKSALGNEEYNEIEYVENYLRKIKGN